MFFSTHDLIIFLGLGKLRSYSLVGGAIDRLRGISVLIHKDALSTITPIKSKIVLEELLQQAHAQFQKGLFGEAAEGYRIILINNPNCHSASHGLALIALQQNNNAEALKFMQQAMETAPTLILYKRNLGELLRRLGQLEAAIAVLLQAISIEPEFAENHFLLALSYNDNHQFELAIAHYRIALSLDKNYGLAWNNLGASLERLGAKEEAKNAYEEAIRLNPKHTEAQNNLGALYSEEGLIDKAKICFQAAITANPDFIEAHYNLSLIKTYTTGDPHLIFLQNFTQKINQCSVRARIHYYFALGKALDDTQQYNAAFKAYAEGNRLHYAQNPWNKTRLHQFVLELPQVFTKDFLRKPKQTKEPLCPIFIVGMPRAGTTLIEQILASHKNIYGAGELSTLDDIIQGACHTADLPFSTWVNQLSDEDCAALGRQYVEQISLLAPDKQFIIDKTPSNCFYIGMIYRMFPNAKIIHAMRDPMDSCFSCFTHLFKNGMLFAYDLGALADYYALYARTMWHWHRVLPPKVLFDLPYEQMIDNHEAFSKQLLDYIGLPWDPNCLNFYKNERMVKTASLTQVRKPIYKTSVQRWRHFAEELKPLVQMIAVFHTDLGEMYRQIKALDLSIHYLQQALTLDSKAANAWSNLGIAYYDAKQHEQAKECHQRALDLNPDLSCSLNNLGSIYKTEEQTQLAIEYYQAAIKASPHCIEPLNNLGVLFLERQEFKKAWHYLHQAVLLAPAFADAHCNLGLTMLGLEQSSNALIHFEQALKLRPDYAEAYFGYAKVFLLQHQFAQSESFIRKAIKLKPQQVEFHQLLADIYHEQGHYTQALMHLDEAIAMNPDFSNLYLSKGNVLMAMGAISQAEEHFLKVSTDLKLDARVNAQYSLVQLSKVKPDSPSLQALVSLINDPKNLQTLASNKLEYVYFALGKCYDDIGEWAQAFRYFSEGCRLKRQSIAYNIQEHIAFTQKIIHCFTQEIIEHLKPFANSSTLPIFIVGMPRSGSTLVEQILSEHAQVYGAGELKYLNNLIQWPIKIESNTLHYPENVPYFSPEIAHAITENYLAYLQSHAPNARHITDKMPYNYMAIGLIHALLPKAKIIHVRRNPIDTCLSCYTKLFTEGQLYSYELTELGEFYRCYERIMTHWRRILPSDAWLEIEYEDIVHNMETEAKRLIKFCDLDWDPACLSFYESKRQVRTASFVQVRQPIYTSSVARWSRYEQELAPLIEILRRTSNL